MIYILLGGVSSLNSDTLITCLLGCYLSLLHTHTHIYIYTTIKYLHNLHLTYLPTYPASTYTTTPQISVIYHSYPHPSPSFLISFPSFFFFFFFLRRLCCLTPYFFCSFFFFSCPSLNQLHHQLTCLKQS